MPYRGVLKKNAWLHLRFAAINLRCLEEFDINSVPLHHYNGRDT